MGLSDICNQQHEREQQRLRKILLWGLASSLGVHAAAFGVGQIKLWQVAEEEWSPIELIIAEADPKDPVPQPNPIPLAGLSSQTNDPASARGSSSTPLASSPAAVVPLDGRPASSVSASESSGSPVAANSPDALDRSTELESSEPDPLEPDPLEPESSEPEATESDLLETDPLETDPLEAEATESESLVASDPVSPPIDTQAGSDLEEPQQPTAATPTPEEDAALDDAPITATTDPSETGAPASPIAELTATRRARFQDWLQRLRGSQNRPSPEGGPSPASTDTVATGANTPGSARSGSSRSGTNSGTGSATAARPHPTAGQGTVPNAPTGDSRGMATAPSAGSGQGRGSRTVACQDCVRPSYPQSALNEGVEGQPRVSVDINPDGTVRNVTLTQSSGNAAIDQAAIEAARNSRFQPIEGGARVPIEYDLTIEGSRRNQAARQRGERQSVEVPVSPTATPPSPPISSTPPQPTTPSTPVPPAAAPSPALESEPGPAEPGPAEPGPAPPPVPEPEVAPTAPQPEVEVAPEPAPRTPDPPPTPAAPAASPPPSPPPPAVPDLPPGSLIDSAETGDE